MAAFLRQEHKPTTPQWSHSSAQASIVLNQAGNHLFTNLDVVSGRVILRCTKDIAVTAIVVKLEGESRTRLLGQTREERRQEPNAQLELHKILYKTATVFPPSEVAETRDHSGKGVFTIPAGTHEYDFNFKLPFNNACHMPSSTLLPGMQMGMSVRGLEMSKIATRHVKTTLPPTLRGFPGEAEISYYVKVTVQRQGLFKENPRSHVPFQFMPIEAPRPPLTAARSYARQQHTFYQDSKKAAKRSLFSRSVPAQQEGPSFSFDMRLPEPAIVTCTQPLPLSLVVTKLSAVPGMVYLQTLQIALIASTKIRTHDLERVEQTATIILSTINLGITAVNDSDAEGTQNIITDATWRNLPLPNTVCPTFATCNISRSYQVEVRAGFNYGGATMDGSKVRKRDIGSAVPQHTILTLRLNASVYSGIAPPKEALERVIADRPTVVAQTPVVPPIHVTDDAKNGETTQTPSDSAVSAAAAAQQPPALPVRFGQDAEFIDAPPSYEDAISAELPPVDGYRPAYAPPPAAEDHLLHRDEKRGWLR